MVKVYQINKYMLKIIVLFLVFNVLVNFIYSQTKITTEVRSQEFGYINFKWTDITLPDTVLNLALRDLNTETELTIQGMFFDKKQKLEVISDSLWYGLFNLQKNEWIGKMNVPESFVNILCNNGIISITGEYRSGYRQQPRYRDEDPRTHDFKDWYEFWFLGKLSINPNFDSYLIFIREKDTAGIMFTRSLFLMNVKDNKITSLSQVAYKFSFYGEGPYQLTKISSQGRYCYYGVSYSEVTFRDRFGKIKEPKLEKLTYFIFDENGYVKVQELKGRKKFFIYKYKHKLFENIR